VLPYADGLVVAILRAALTAEVGTLVPHDLYGSPRPFVLARRVGGAAILPGHLDGATVDVQAYAATRRAAAELAELARTALYVAWRDQTVFPDGHVAGYGEISGPAELRTNGQPDGLYRFQATYSLALRPPRT
jgi:hypothetical protein